MSDIISSILLNAGGYFFILYIFLMVVAHTLLGNSLILLGMSSKIC